MSDLFSKCAGRLPAETPSPVDAHPPMFVDRWNPETNQWDTHYLVWDGEQYVPGEVKRG
jgi:hypothetical protein